MFDRREYVVREELVGSSYGVYTPGSDDPLLTAAEEKLAVKEDFRFADPDSGEEVLWLKAESVLDVAAAYDVVDERTGEYVGSVQRSVISVLRHDYEIRDHRGDLLATVEEASWITALIRRQLTDALPFTYRIEGVEGEEYGEISERLGFRDEYEISLAQGVDDEGTGESGTAATAGEDGTTAATGESESAAALDPRLAVVAIVIIDAIEGL